MQRMHSENRRDKRAPPQRACHAFQRHKKKDDGARVQEDISKVVPAGVYSVELAIKHMCDCRQRMPVFGMDMRKRPGDVGDADATRDPRVLINVTRIVVVNEIVPECLTKDDPRQDEETDANAGGHPR